MVVGRRLGQRGPLEGGKDDDEREVNNNNRGFNAKASAPAQGN